MHNSNRWRRRCAVSIALAIMLNAVGNVCLMAQSGGSFQITNSVVAGGGGESRDATNNRFGHEGTVGEAAAGTLLRNPPYSQTAGLWASNVGLSPTAAPASVSGRVLSPEGAPLAGVVIDLTGSRSVRTITNASGDYEFPDIEVGGFYTITASRVNYIFSPRELTFSLLANKTDALFTAVPTEVTANPLDTPEFFVRQHYLDLLQREPDQVGFGYWTSRINRCAGNQSCVHAARIDVSNAFFFELEFQQTGAYVFRLYRAAFGNNQPSPNPDSSNLTEALKLPSYSVFASERAGVVAGVQLAASQLALANSLVQRAEFLVRYPASLNGQSFVDAVLATIKNDSGADLTAERSALTTLFFNGEGRAGVMYRLADDAARTNPINNRKFVDAEYNRAFVFTQYAGYLRRNPDLAGFLFWLGQVSSAEVRDVGRQHAMVCAFITSAEYQRRFSSVVTRSNADCQ